MAKKRRQQPHNAVGSGNQNEARNDEEPKQKRARSQWRIDVLISDVPVIVDGHPLAGLSDSERIQARWKALGEVLASIAKRNAAITSGDENRSPLSEEQIPPNQTS